MKLREKAYQSLVRPITEYSCTVWDPHQCKDTSCIEMVQRRGARFVTQDYHQKSSVTDMLKRLDWDSLSNRRMDARLTMMYKIIHHLAVIPHDGILIPADPRTRANHSYKFKAIQSKTTPFRHSFFVSTIPHWNSLPRKTVESKNLKIFKSNRNSERNGKHS